MMKNINNIFSIFKFKDKLGIQLGVKNTTWFSFFDQSIIF